MAPPVARKPASQAADVVTLPDGTTVRAEKESIPERKREQSEGESDGSKQFERVSRRCKTSLRLAECLSSQSSRVPIAMARIVDDTEDSYTALRGSKL